MSAIFGEFSRNGPAVTMQTLDTMVAAMPRHGDDGQGRCCTPPLGLGHPLHAITPESSFEHQPLVHARSRITLCAQARLDNRDTLLTRLQLRSTPAAPITDADLILAAYLAWGEASAQQLLGDFAFAQWDGREQKLLCVRDQIGIAPLYYHLSAGHFVFASDVRGVLTHPAVPHTLSTPAIAQHLSYLQYTQPETTFFCRNPQIAPRPHPGHHRHQRARTRILGTTSRPAVRLPTAAYAEQLSQLLDQAVQSRLRSAYPLGAHVSGGLDSSAIVVISKRHTPAIMGYSWLPTPTAEHAQAPEYQATQRMQALGVAVENVDLTEQDLRAMLGKNIGVESHADLLYEPLVRARAKARGIRVLLSGWGGDELVSGYGNGYLAELFWHGRWLQLAQRVASHSRHQSRPWRTELAIMHAHILQLPLPDRWRPRGFRIDPLTGLHTDLARALPPSGLQALRRIGVRAPKIRTLRSGALQERIEAAASQGAIDGIEYRYPLLDHRIVESCLGLPSHLFAWGRTRPATIPSGTDPGATQQHPPVQQ